MAINILGYMRSFSRFIKISVLSVLAVWGLVSCGKDDRTVISADLKLVPDKMAIEPNGIDPVTFAVEYDGIDVTDKSTVYREDGSVAGLTFTADAEGSYGFYAEYNGERSATVTIVATGMMPAMPEDPEPDNRFLPCISCRCPRQGTAMSLWSAILWPGTTLPIMPDRS